MSIEYTPEQSLAGAGVPPEPSEIERLIGVFKHRMPPWNTTAARPELVYIRSPLLLLRTLLPWMTNPEPAEALEEPLEASWGKQPSELIFAVQ